MKAPTITLEALHLKAAATHAEISEPALQEEGQSAGGGLGDFMFPMAACFLVFWFIVIRPEKRQRKAREEMLSSLKKGDEVITSGGIHGRVAQVKDEVVTVQVSDGVRLRISLSAVQVNASQEDAEKEDETPDVPDSSTPE